MNPRICVIGSINMDLVIRAPRFPQPGETLIGGQFRTFPGGKGANQAVAAARLGSAVTMIGCVGDDPYGQTLRSTLQSESVDATHVAKRREAATGIAAITVNPEGENTIVVVPGANACITPDDVAKQCEILESADALVMQLEIPLAAVRRGAELARAAGRRVILNAAPAHPLAIELLELVDVLIVNRTEAALLSGDDPASRPQEMARALHARGARQVVITLSTQGAIAYDGQSLHAQPAFQVNAIDATAAGDAFVGALATCLAAGQPFEQSLRMGAAAGALAATKLGAMPSLPYRHEVERLLCEMA